jgi:hypothetical protein
MTTGIPTTLPTLDKFKPGISSARDLTGTWRNGIPAQGLIVWDVHSPNMKYYSDLELELIQTHTGNTNYDTITGRATFTLRSLPPTLRPPNYCPPELSARLNKPETHSLTGKVGSNNIEFTAGYYQYKGTFLTDSMSGTVVDIPSNPTPSNTVVMVKCGEYQCPEPQRGGEVELSWKGTFNLGRVW